MDTEEACFFGVSDHSLPMDDRLLLAGECESTFSERPSYFNPKGGHFLVALESPETLLSASSGADSSATATSMPCLLKGRLYSPHWSTLLAATWWGSF